jgi:putative ABC transport system permease protein
MLFYYPTFLSGEYHSLYINSNDLPSTLASIAGLWGEVLPENPFDYIFLEEYFNKQYEAENQFEEMFGIFSLLAIIVACLGLYGMSSFMTHQRRKEIAIRKVHGSNFPGLLLLLYKDFFVLILLSLVISSPFIYWFGDRWLSNFSFRINLSWAVFILPLIILVLISIITSIIQTVKASLENPTYALRY